MGRICLSPKLSKTWGATMGETTQFSPPTFPLPVQQLGNPFNSAWPTKRWRGMAAVPPCRLLSLSLELSLPLGPLAPDARLPILEAKPDPPEGRSSPSQLPPSTLRRPTQHRPVRPQHCLAAPSHPRTPWPRHHPPLPLLSLPDTAPAAQHLSS